MNNIHVFNHYRYMYMYSKQNQSTKKNKIPYDSRGHLSAKD